MSCNECWRSEPVAIPVKAEVCPGCGRIHEIRISDNSLLEDYITERIRSIIQEHIDNWHDSGYEQ